MRCIAVSPQSLPFGWTGTPPLRLGFKRRYDPTESHLFIVTLGVCARTGENASAPLHWANVEVGWWGKTTGRYRSGCAHACPEDHIASWPNWERIVPLVFRWHVTIRFAEWTMGEKGKTLVLSADWWEERLTYGGDASH